MDRRLMLVALSVALAGALAGLFVTLGAPRGSPERGGEHGAPVGTPEAETVGGPVGRPRAPSDPLTRLDEDIAARGRRADARADDWLDLEFLGGLFLERQRLTGEYEDFAGAERAVDEAFARARTGSGPFLLRARLNYALHRLDRIEPDLLAVEAFAIVSPDELLAIRSMRADVAFQMGRYDEALRLYEAEVTASGAAVDRVALAQYRWRTGDGAGARTLLDEADSVAASEPEGTRAWLALVRGLVELDLARLPDARAAFERGLELSPGWWQLEEHLAQVALLEGDTDGALAAYEALVDRAPSPELMDAIAAIHRDEGRTTEMLAWRERARAGHEARLSLYPEAAAGHAVDHWLELEDEPERLVALAEANRDARPGGEAQTKLAMAYLRAERIEDALGVVALLDATPWSTPESHAVRAMILELAGETDAAAAQRARAEALAPGATERAAWLRRGD